MAASESSSSPFDIIFQMVQVLIDTTISTLLRIVQLFGEFVKSLGVASETGGPFVFVASVLLLAVVGFFLAKVFLGGGKRLLYLIPLGIILVYLFLLGIIA